MGHYGMIIFLFFKTTAMELESLCKKLKHADDYDDVLKTGRFVLHQWKPKTTKFRSIHELDLSILRETTLHVIWFNNICSIVTYSLKLICLFLSIFCCALQMRECRPIVATVSINVGPVGLYTCFAYILAFDTGYKVTESFQRCKAEVLRQMRSLNGKEKRRLEAQMKPLRVVEIRMGAMASILLFLQFVTTVTANFIVTLPAKW